MKSVRPAAILVILLMGQALLFGCQANRPTPNLEPPDPEKVHPYMQFSGPGGVPTVIWTCDTAPGTVILRESGNLETKIPVPESGTFHAVPLEGLLPDTEYSYQVVSGDRLSSEHIFRTLPERRPDGTSAPFPFIAYGDNRSKPDRHEEVIDSILKGPAPSLVVSTGDLVYSGSDRKRWFREFLDPAEALFARVPIMLSLGNHDLDLDAPKPRPLAPFWLENFAFPGHLDDPGYGRWFSLDAGGVHFLILDSTSEKNEDQMRWLREDLSSAESRGADFRIAVFHHPPYAAGGHDSSLSLRRIWEPLFVEHGVDLVFNGHNHYYQRSWPVVGGEVQARAMHQEGSDIIQAGQAPVYVVTGGGGAPLYDPKEKDFVAVSAKSHHHVLVQYVPGALNCRAIDTNGVILDEFTLINGE